MSISIFLCILISQFAGGPSEASARYALRRSPRITDLTGSVTRSAYSASSGGCAREGCACGVPPELLQDSLGSPLAYVSLNVQVRQMGPLNAAACNHTDLTLTDMLVGTDQVVDPASLQNTAMSSRKLSRPIPDTSESIGMFSNGQNCGRWVEITHGVKCMRGKTDPSRQPPVVCGVDASFGDPRFNYAADSKTGTKTYALVADGCSDDNFWCAQRSVLADNLAVKSSLPVSLPKYHLQSPSWVRKSVLASQSCALRCTDVWSRINQYNRLPCMDDVRIQHCCAHYRRSRSSG